MAASYRAGYLAKYATKSTEITGHVSARLTADTIDLYADRPPVSQGGRRSSRSRLASTCCRPFRLRITYEPAMVLVPMRAVAR